MHGTGTTAEITRDETSERARLLSIDSYDVALDLTRGSEVFGSRTLIEFDCAEAGAATYADLIAETVHAVTLNGVPIDPAHAWADGRIALTGLAAHNVLEVVADCAYGTGGFGLQRSVDSADGRVYTFTQFEAAHARRVFANFEQPDLKATFTFHVTVPADWTVLSNQTALDRRPADTPDAVWDFPATPRISTYLTAIAAGEYHVVRDSHTTPGGQVIPLGLACRQSMVPFLDGGDILMITRQGLDYFTQLFGSNYPFDKYDQVFVPDNAGAMENVGCVILTESLLFRSKVTDTMYEERATVILHEMAHQWFGDLVTMKWWEDLWLNESFAELAGYLATAEATRFTQAWTSFCGGRKIWGYGQDQLPSTHPIAADVPTLSQAEANFDGISYAKGAAVLKQLVAYVGRDAFFAGIRAYFAEHQWGNATLADLMRALEASSGRSLADWSKAWLETAGPNTLRAEFTAGPDGQLESFSVLQEAPADHPTLRPHHIAIGLYDLVNGALVRTYQANVDVAGARTEVPALAGRPQPDLILLNDDDLGYALIRFDERSLTTLTEHIGRFRDGLARTLCWSAVVDMASQAELSVPDFVTIVAAGMGSEESVAVLQLLHAETAQLLTTTADPAWVPLGKQLLAAEAVRLLHAAEPASDHQLAWAQLLAATAVTPEQLDVVAGLLDGSVTVPGLTVDTDLRWQLLRRLAAMGLAGDAEIDAEMARDDTDAGRRNAAAARASIPDAEHKAAAWRQVAESTELGLEESIAVSRAFNAPEHADVLAPYAEKYFEELPSLWAARADLLRVLLGRFLFPYSAASPELLGRIDAFLATPDLDPTLARVVIEGRDIVEKALRSRALAPASGHIVMQIAEITRAETSERARLLVVDTYDVTLDLTRGPEVFGSTSAIRFQCAEPGADTYVDLVAESVREITLNGAPIDPATAWAAGRIALPGLARENELTIVADCRYSRDGTGLHRAVDPVDQKVYTYTKFEPAYARTVYANFEQPDLKASFRISVLVPSHWQVVANEPLDEQTPAGDGFALWRFLPTPRLSTYLFAVAAGEYQIVRTAHTTPAGQVIPLGLACRASMAEFQAAADILDTTRRGLDYYTSLFRTDYPFAKYDQVFVPEYSVGATENAGCVIFTDQLLFRSRVTDTLLELRASVILHEMAHMWFGDLVTMKWWDDLWLNESFAEFCAALASAEATRYTDAWTTFATGRKAWGYAQDQLPSTHPIAADVPTLSEAIANFDGISYAKGASVLRQLVATIGRDSFFAGIRAYFETYGWGNATLADWLATLAASSGASLTDWSRAWLETAGPSTLRSEFEVGPDGSFTSFAVLQEAPAEHPTLRPHRIAIGLYGCIDGELVRTGQVRADIAGPRTDIPELAGATRPDLIALNDGDLTYAIIRFDDRSIATLTTSIGLMRDSLTRAVCWTSVIDMVRQAELPVPALITMAVRAMASEPSVAALQSLLDKCADLLRTMADPAWAATGYRQLADVGAALLLTAEPGSDHQLAWAQLLSWSATSPDQLDLAAGLLDGSGGPAGLSVGSEARWALLQRLAVAGRAGDAEIDAELERDKTDAGYRSAAACRAAIGDAEHKDAAWWLLAQSADISADLLRSVAFAFHQPEQAALLAPYAERYFEVLPDIWSASGGHLRVARGAALFPVTAASPELVERIDQFLAAAEREPGLVRVLVERRDQVLRALRSRALSAAVR